MALPSASSMPLHPLSGNEAFGDFVLAPRASHRLLHGRSARRGRGQGCFTGRLWSGRHARLRMAVLRWISAKAAFQVAGGYSALFAKMLGEFF